MTDKDTPPKGKDPWSTESSFDTVISIDELIDRPPFREVSGKDGGSYTAAARIPTWLERKITHLIEVKGSPYQLKSDVVRDAIYLGLRVLNMRYKSSPEWAVEAKMANAIDKVNALSRMRTQIESFCRPVLDLWENGDEIQARQAVEDFVSALVEIEDDWMRSKSLQLMKTNKHMQSIIETCSDGIKRAVNDKKSH